MDALYPYQLTGIDYLCRNRRALLADEMGLGKTVQALMALERLNAYPALIVTPASVKLPWLREIERWLPHRRAQVLYSTDRLLPDQDFFILNYDLLARNLEQLKAREPWTALILDESSFVKSWKAQRTKAAQQIRSLRTWMLSGTPVLNRPAELVSQLRILGHLNQLGGFWYFLKRYAGARRTRFGLDVSRAYHLDELNRILTERQIMLRRTKAEVALELPEKRFVRIPIALGEKERHAYFLAEADFQTWLRQTRGQGAVDRAIRAEQLVRVGALKQLVADLKYTQVVNWIDDFLETGNKLVVFAYYRETQRRLLERYPTAARILAEESAPARQTNIDLFQTSPDCQLMIASLMAGGMGITLTAASACAFMELAWTPAIHIQATDRLHRIGQREAVTAYYLLAEETVDYRVMRMLERKWDICSTITDGEVLDSLFPLDSPPFPNRRKQ